MTLLLDAALLLLVPAGIVFLCFCLVQFSRAMQHPDPLTKWILRSRRPRLRVAVIEGSVSREAAFTKSVGT